MSKNVYRFHLVILEKGGVDPLDSSYTFPDHIIERTATTIAETEQKAQANLPRWLANTLGTAYELQNATLEEVTPLRSSGRPRKGKGTRHVDLTLSIEVIEALDTLGVNKSQFVDRWLRQHPEIARVLNETNQ